MTDRRSAKRQTQKPRDRLRDRLKDIQRQAETNRDRYSRETEKPIGREAVRTRRETDKLVQAFR